MVRRARGKWACSECEKLVQAPAAPLIDKGLPTTGPLAQALVGQFADHLRCPAASDLCRAGPPIPKSTLGQWVDSRGVQLQPLVGARKAELLQQRVLHADAGGYARFRGGQDASCRLGSYCSTALQHTKSVVFDLAESRASRHPANFLGRPGERACRDTLI